MDKSDIGQPIPIILNGSNYSYWAEAMMDFLKGRRLWRYITGDFKCPVKSTDLTDAQFEEKLEEWDSKNYQVISWFRNVSTPSIHLQFGRFNTAKEVWDHLKKRYTISDLSHQYQLLKELHSLKQESGQSVYDFLAKMEVVWDQLTLCEPSIKNEADLKSFDTYRDRTRLIQFLMALTDDYEPVRASLLHQDPLPTLEDALPRLKSEETRLSLLRPTTDMAFATTSKTKTCRFCHKIGHLLPECPNITCRTCKRKGHIAPNCTTNCNYCNYCKQSGHTIQNCPTRPPRQNPSTNQSSHNSARPVLATATAATPSSSTSITASDLESLLKQILSSGNTSVALSTAPGNARWYFDSACCNHMTSTSNHFSSLYNTDTAPTINTADGSLMHVSHKGDISLHNLTLPNTYLIPKLNFNLISVGQICDMGYDITFTSSGCYVQDPRTSQIVGTGCKVGRLFELTKLHLPSMSNLCAVSSSPSLQLWHQRLVHCSVGKMRPLVSSGALGSLNNSSFDCTSCQTAKQPALSFNKSHSISKSPFDLIHSDIWGPAPTSSMGGSRYFVIFIDDYSRYTWIYLLKNRHELPQTYIQFATMIKTQFDKKIKVFRRDNAMEYRDSKLLTFLSNQGTLSEFSCPGTSQQNGRAERKHRHILDSVRAMLISSSCPERTWGEAALTAVYVINRLPSTVLGNTSPFQSLYNTTPDYNFLKVFGCACFVLLQSHEYSKLEPRARLCCFLGYSTEHKGYRCWDPISQRIRVSRHVIFWEHHMFSSLASFHSIPSTTTPFFSNSFNNVLSDEDTGQSHESTAVPDTSISPDNFVSNMDPTTTHPDSLDTPTPTPSLRRSTRERKTPEYLDDYECLSTVLNLYEPQSYKEASANPHWQQAMKEELLALEKTHTWDLVDPPSNKTLVGCKWIYKIKTHSDGTIERYKARLVAKGFTQEYGIDYEETFAPVARITSVRVLLAIAAAQKWKLSQMDVKNAFLNGELEEEVYMHPPQGYNCPSNKVCLLRKALYGLKQAPRAWFSKFSSTIIQLGFSPSPHDSALFIRKTDHGTVILLLYVDDMIITGDDCLGITMLKESLKHQFEMKDLGSLKYFLGLEVNSTADGISLSQSKYASDLITRAEITDRRIESTPFEPNARLTPVDGTALDNPTRYRQLVGSLIYLTVTRPDISYAVHIVSQFMTAPRSTHYAAVLRILRYVKGTLCHGLYFSNHSSLILQAYSDADWGGDPTDRRSTTGYCLFLGDSLISWRSKKQNLTARSSTESEYRALADTAAETLWIRWLLNDLGISQPAATHLYCDNKSAIQIAHNDVFHERTKHIEIDCHFIRQHISNGVIKLLSIGTLDQPADIFTKSHHPGRFRTLSSKLKIISSQNYLSLRGDVKI